ncbi:2OG-Fe(II) oxygenase [Eleftheria terrae]|uniref:2OG-Fe(II) oxygenase n=1 Tax=Eleftheria terrae TaxID=1597781 RepID=UPI00263AC2B9|nr:2OG-Fe(II) oxygenase [Eleftheria terrae]WKB51707.1 2OG-Fe(II) oxygenase [Eleftheria terrae]
MQIDHHHPDVFSLPGFRSPEACAALILAAEAQGFAAAGVQTAQGVRMMSHIRNNDRLLYPSPAWAAAFWEDLRRLPLPVIDGQVAQGVSEQFRFYRYLPGQRFKMHKDGRLRERGLESRLTFLLYLNDGFSGGETDFREFQVAPAVGTALLFVHETWHEGRALTAGSKYVLRSDLLYGPAG